MTESSWLCRDRISGTSRSAGDAPCYAGPAMAKRTLVSLLLLVAAGISTPVISKQSGPSDELVSGNGFVQKARESSDIMAPGSPAFVLVARVKLTERKQELQGVYASSWAGPSRFRRILNFGDFTETDVASGNEIFKKRTTKAIPLLIWELDTMMESFVRRQLSGEWKVARAAGEQREGDTVECMTLREEKNSIFACADRASGDISSIELGHERKGSFRGKYEFFDYRAFGDKRFPWRIKYSGWAGRRIEINVEKLTQVRSFVESEFTPLAGSMRFGYCGGAEAVTTFADAGPGRTPPFFDRVDAVVYLEIGPDGRVRQASMLDSSSPVDNAEILEWFTGAAYPVRVCGGKNYAYETLLKFAGMR